MSKRYIIRLDDASDHMDLEKWHRIEALLDKYDVKPIFGIIPDNQDETLTSKYDFNPEFWQLIHRWIKKGWIPAMHGYQHKYVTKDGGINPVNHKSEFAGLSYDEQALKIRNGWKILSEQNIFPDIFFAPAHTYDNMTLEAVKNETSIRIISDTPAYDMYRSGDFVFVPQQCGNVRWLPFKTVTFCYHPNTMTDKDFNTLERFIVKYRSKFKNYDFFETVGKRSFLDKLINNVYYILRMIRRSVSSRD